MNVHPTAASDTVALVLGVKPNIRPGWNRVVMDPRRPERALYTFLGPDGAMTTPNPPPPGEPVHEATPEVVPWEASAARQALARLTEQVAVGDVPFRAALDPAGVLQTIDERVSVRAATDPPYGQYMIRSMKAIRAAVSASWSGDVRIGDIDRAPFELIEDYLNLKVPGAAASQVLAAILQIQCNVPSCGPPHLTRSEHRLAAAKHLMELTYDLMEERNNGAVGDFFELSYLASLYGQAALALMSAERELHPKAVLDGVSLARVLQTLEEHLAHDVAPCFWPPVFLALGPEGFAAVLDMHGSKDAASAARALALPAALTARLDPKATFGSHNWPIIIRDYLGNQPKATVNVFDRIQNDWRPVARDNQAHILREMMAWSMFRPQPRG